MRGADRVIIVVLPLIALAAGFWFLVIAPERNRAGELGEQIESLEASIAAGETEIAAAEAARNSFPENYGTLVSLGRAAPADDDQATLVFDLSGLSRGNDLSFRDFEVMPAAAGAPEPPPEEAPAEQPEESAAPVGEDGAAPAPATEAAAALLPIGATPGTGAYAVMPYEFRFLGDFFDMASFFGDVDDLVKTKGGEPKVNGRLLTINGFSLTGNSFTGFPDVEANFSVTSYVLPDGQDLTAGATPTGPAPAAPDGEPAPVSAEGGTTP